VKSGAEKGLELGGAVTRRGLEAGKGAVDDTVNHFYREGTAEEVRARVDKMAYDTLDRLFSRDPETQLLFDAGVGYAVFEVRQLSMTVLAGYGYGVAVTNDGGQRIYMKMVSGGLELSKGLGGFVSQWVVLFEDQAAFDEFVTQGFDASAETSGTLGGERAELGTRYLKGASFYRVTEAGLKVAATLSGTRFWSDGWLNGVEGEPAEVPSGPDMGPPVTGTPPTPGPVPVEPPISSPLPVSGPASEVLPVEQSAPSHASEGD
jgi:hypothetical protein